MKKILSVIIPAYNEAKTVKTVLEKVCSVSLVGGFTVEIVVVNDASTDSTEAEVQSFIESNPEASVQLHSKTVNQGKGSAIRTGIELATGELIIVQDADLEYDPEEFNILLDPILKGYADVVYGSRFVGGKAHRILFFWHTIGNKILTAFSNMLTNLNLSDMETCYKLFRSDIVKKISLHENRFGFEPEITAKISKVPGIRIYEVGISYYGRTYAEGKKINWKDGFRAIYCILKYNLFSR